jgi:hypothetical protein
MPAFGTLGRSESRQMAAVKVLLSRYKIEDPVAGRRGEFRRPELRPPLPHRRAPGPRSRRDALEVGMRLERAEIRALHARLLTAAYPDVRRLLTQLKQASTNHLHLLEHQLEEAGHTSDHLGDTGDR